MFFSYFILSSLRRNVHGNTNVSFVVLSYFGAAAVSYQYRTNSIPIRLHIGTHTHTHTGTSGERAEHQFQIFSRATYDVFIVVVVCAHISYHSFSSSLFVLTGIFAFTLNGGRSHDLSVCPNLIPKLKKKISFNICDLISFSPLLLNEICFHFSLGRRKSPR